MVVYREYTEQCIQCIEYRTMPQVFRTVSLTLKVLVVATVIIAMKSVFCRIMISFGRMEQFKDWELKCCNRAE